MQLLAGGTFTMGGINGEPDELPQRIVRLPPFLIDKYEVTEAQYDSCVKAGFCSKPHYDDGKCLMWTKAGFRNVKVHPSLRNPSFPVVCVSWEQARQYCKFKGSRLPYEAEWEYAASEAGKSQYGWGNTPAAVGRCQPAGSIGPSKVGSYPPNSFNLFDMSGNVWEWTEDFYDKNYYAYADTQTFRGPAAGYYRVIRGGGWYSEYNQLRVQNRFWFAPSYSEVSIGFRCARSITNTK